MEASHQKYLDFSHPLIEGIMETYALMVRDSLTPGNPYLKSSALTLEDINAITILNGRSFRGKFILSWPLSTYLNTVGLMLGKTYSKWCQEIAEIGNEIGRIGLGKAHGPLQSKGFFIQDSSSRLCRGKIAPSTRKAAKRLSLPWGEIAEIFYWSFTIATALYSLRPKSSLAALRCFARRANRLY